MFLLANILILIGACLLIFKTTELFVRGTVDLATALRLPKVFVGLTLVSLVTTAPEFIVSVSSSYIGNSGMAVGNALGSCICNIGLVFATGILLKELRIHEKDYKSKLFFLVGILLLMFLFITNGWISRIEAFILLAILAVFMFLNYRIAMEERETIQEMIHPDKKNDLIKKGGLLFLFGGIGTVLLARYGMVNTGINIATLLNVPSIIIGLSIIAIGTSLPELVTVIVSSRGGHSEIALGNVIGANILNLLLVLGSSALINPLTIDTQTIFFTMPAVLALTLVMFFLGFKDHRYSKREGFILLGLYLFYLTALFTFLY